MGWFRSKKAKAGAFKEAHLSASAQKIADWILGLQSRFAARLNALAQKFGIRNMAFIIVAVLTGFGIYCAWILIRAML